MRQHFLTDLWSLIWLLVFLGYLIRSHRRLGNRIGAKALWRMVPGTMPYNIMQLLVTGIVALIIADIFGNDLIAPVYFILWPGLFLLWKYWDRRRTGQALNSSPDLQARLNGQVSPTQPPRATTLPVPSVRPKNKPRDAFRSLGKFAAGVAVLLFVGMGTMIFALSYYHRQAEAEHDKIHIGMTAEQVLSVVQNYFSLHAYSDAPKSGPDDFSHSVSLMIDSDGLLRTYDLSSRQPRMFSPQAAAELMHDKLGDGYEWHWRYTFVNDTPQHISFSVTFGPDGRVKEIKPVYGWD